MDGSATVVREGYAPYGTDDVSDDVTQDAVLIFTQNLRRVLEECAVNAYYIDTRQPYGWLYVRKDGQERTVTRRTLQKWAVRDAARRNGYRLDVPLEETDTEPNHGGMRGVPHAEYVANASLASAQASAHSDVIWRMAFGDGAEFPTLRAMTFHASRADDLGRDGIIATTAQARHGGVYGSRRNVRRTRDAARREWVELSARLDHVRDDLFYRSDQRPREH
jgi:galactarate dehydratase